MSEQPTAAQQAQVDALRAVAQDTNSDMTIIVGRDAKGRLLDVSVLTRGRDAAELLRWIKRKERKRK